MAFGPNPNTVAPPGGLSRKRPVAGYLRSATELEGESLRKQFEAIVRYARDHGMQLIRVYCDECGSGLRTDGRSGVGQMLRDIESGDSDFGALLLLDPSRWGRFHISDESACLEYARGATGIEIHYCAEGLDGEYGREAAARGHRAVRAADGNSAVLAGETTPEAKTR